MPGGLTIEYPHGQSLDENGVVQLDGDWRFEGGVTPDIRVPLTMDTVRAQFKDGTRCRAGDRSRNVKCALPRIGPQ